MDLPAGFDYLPEFVSEEEERQYVDFAREQQLSPFVFRGNPSKRVVLNYGVNFDYEHKVPYLDDAIPALFTPLLARVAGVLDVPVERMVELLITNYPPGATINWRRDSRPFEAVAAVSLLSDCDLKLRPAPTKSERRTPITTVRAERRSMYVLTGPARTAWMHRVPPVDETRMSITLRTVRPEWDVVGTARPDGVPLHFDR